MKAVEAVAQAFSTLNIGTRSGNSPLLDQRLEQRLGTDRVLAPEAHAAIAQPARLDVGAVLLAGIGERTHIGLSRQVTEAHAGMLLEDGGIGADHIDVAHGCSSGGVSLGWLSQHLSVSKWPALGEPTWPQRPRHAPSTST
jgi:hypothetical protein